MLKRKEFELQEMESRLRESQRSLKIIYDKEDQYGDQHERIDYQNQNQNKNRVTEDFRHNQANDLNKLKNQNVIF